MATYSLHTFNKLCKAGKYIRADDKFRFYYRLYQENLFNSICIYCQPGVRKTIRFGCYSLFGKIFYSTGGILHLPLGTYTTESLAKILGVPIPKSLEEDYLFMEHHGFPFLDRIQTQRGLIAAESARGSLFPNGITPWNLNICGAHLKENERRIALERVSLIISQNLSAFLSNNRRLLETGPADDFAKEMKLWLSDRNDVFECYRIMTAGSEHDIAKYLEEWRNKNVVLIKQYQSQYKRTV